MPDSQATTGRITSVDEIRAALRQQIAETTLRGTARDLGMSPTGLRSFADGRDAFDSTLRRARAWYARWALEHGQAAVADENALEVLFGPLPESSRDVAIASCRRVIEALRSVPP
jgi:methylphosphotriester-DNA--protein-cysteine methyltransferase